MPNKSAPPAAGNCPPSFCPPHYGKKSCPVLPRPVRRTPERGKRPLCPPVPFALLPPLPASSGGKEEARTGRQRRLPPRFPPEFCSDTASRSFRLLPRTAAAKARESCFSSPPGKNVSPVLSPDEKNRLTGLCLRVQGCAALLPAARTSYPFFPSGAIPPLSSSGFLLPNHPEYFQTMSRPAPFLWKKLSGKTRIPKPLLPDPDDPAGEEDTLPAL